MFVIDKSHNYLYGNNNTSIDEIWRVLEAAKINILGPIYRHWSVSYIPEIHPGHQIVLSDESKKLLEDYLAMKALAQQHI